MATVRPFRGIVFDPVRVPDLGLVTCPPYDVISPADRTALYDRHPCNVVRVVSGREEDGDSPAENKYTRAAGFFRSWLWEGVLRQEERPALYAYRQAFADPSGHFRRVWGLLATVRIDDRILAHEKTMPGPKADRLALMEAIPANLSPIYGLYKEDGGGVSHELQSFAAEHPVADFADGEGTRHTVWAIHDETFCDKVAQALDPSPLLIADGHHRFETAKRYRRLRLERGDGPGPWDEIMILLVDAGAQPVCILPYHRIVVHADRDPVAVFREAFEIEELGTVDEAGARKLGLGLWDEPGAGTFVAFVGDRGYRLRADDVGPDEIPAGVLKRKALEGMGTTFAEGHLSFTPRPEEVWAECASGRARCGFLMQPVHPEAVWDLAASGATMPEKSTYFHPKPRDGIVMRLLDRPPPPA